MTLRHLEIFLAVCRFMSMTKAADSLHMTQPAVSKAIAELEVFYHKTLFDRIGRRLYLTEAGSALQNYASGILSRYEESVTYLRDGSSFQSCRLSVNVTAAETILADLCLMLQKEIPDLNLKLSVDNAAAIERQLRSNECDIAILDRREDLMFESVPLYRESVCFAASDQIFDGSALTEEQLLSHRLLLREPGSGTRACVEGWLQKISFPAGQIWQCTSDEVILEMAEKGLGIAVLPESYLSRHASRTHPVSAGDEPFVRRFYLVHLRSKYLNQSTLQCIRLIEQFCSGL